MKETDSTLVRGRFAPTPSGRMHLGNVLCALLAWLSVRAQRGVILLRIEDLDSERCPLSYAKALEDDLRWLGLDWDEGGLDGTDKSGGSCIQSRRTAHYEKTLEALRACAVLYPCFCSRAELHAAQAPHLSDGRVLYAGTCKALTPEEARLKLALRPAAIRIAVPDEVVCFTDLCRGEYEENLKKDCGDFILKRSDGVFAYQLAVAADDMEMGVTEVVRGADLLFSAARQIWLIGLLGGRPPVYGHIPLLLAPDGRRLSKRDADLDLSALKKRFSAEQILGLLAHLCGLTETEEPISAKELIPLFSWDKLKKENIRLSASFYASL